MSENINKLFSPIHIVEDISSTPKTLDVYDSGKIFFLDRAAGLEIILPSPTGNDMAGWHATFIVKSGSAASGVTDFAFYVGGSPPFSHIADKLRGSIRSTDGGVPLSGSHASGSVAGSADIAVFQGHSSRPAADRATAGDLVNIYCDGALYYCDALVAQSASFVFADM